MKPAPKDPQENAAYRRYYIERSQDDPEFQRECWIRCARDPVWYCDTWLWTYSPKDHEECPDRPFILWPYQEDALLKLIQAFGKHPILIEKSRDMGASWVCCVAADYREHFCKGQSFLFGSRKEEYVDKSGDPKALFWKLDYLRTKLPGWLQPNINRIKLHIHNLDNGSTINGESTNDDFARGDRRTAIFLDEFAAVDNGHQILTATRDATNCRVFNSTPQGASGAYYEMREKLATTHPEWIIRFHWTQHPEKSVGLYTTENNEEGGKLKILDHAYKFPDDYPFIRDGKLRSPWYDRQCEEAANQQEIAQELDINYAGSAWRFFEEKTFKPLEKESVRPPYHRGEMFYQGHGKNAEWIDQGAGGRVELWCHLDPDGKPPLGQYVIGCDVATGKGGEMSSNSVASIANRITGEKVGQFTTNKMLPPFFCDYSVALCRFFYDAFLIWEENGPGGEFTAHLRDNGYRNVFYREDEESFVKKKTRKPGWWSTKDTKRILLGKYAKDLLAKRFINHSAEAFKELAQYVHYPNGTIAHSRSLTTIDPTSSGENHGDIVIADAVANRGMADVAVVQEEDTREPPDHSFLGRRLRSQKKQLQTSRY